MTARHADKLGLQVPAAGRAPGPAAEADAQPPQAVLLPAGCEPGAYPPEDIPAETFEHGSPARPYVPAPDPAADPGLFPGLLAAFGLAPEAPAPPPDLSGALIYGEPGWIRIVEAARIRSGEWTDVLAFADEGYARNVADYVASLRHSRRTIIDAARLYCTAFGCPDQADALLRKVEDRLVKARQAAERRPAFTPAPPTRPQRRLQQKHRRLLGRLFGRPGGAR